MEWLSELISNYLSARFEHSSQELFKGIKSFYLRTTRKTSGSEIGRLMTLESKFNNTWIEKVSEIFEKNNLTKEDSDKSKLNIDTLIKKHKSRSFSLVALSAILGLIVGSISSQLAPLIIIAIAMIIFVGERLYLNDYIDSLEELKQIIDYVVTKKNI